jgi:hypothetical protein
LSTPSNGPETQITQEPAGGAPAPTPGVYSAANAYQTAYNEAWYATRATQVQPLYYGRAGVTVPDGAAPLTQAQFIALVQHLVENIPVNPANGKLCPLVEGIDVFGGDPYTYNLIASQSYGYTWFPAGHGYTQSTEVIQIGQFVAPPPTGTPFTPITTDIADLLAGGSIGPWPAPPAPAPVVISDVVGLQMNNNQYASAYGVKVGPGTPYPVGTKETDLRGTFILGAFNNMFGVTYLWVLQPVKSA